MKSNSAKEPENKMPQGFDPKNMPKDFDPSKMPKDFDPKKMPKDFDPSKMPKDFDPSKMPGAGPQVDENGKKIYKRTSSSGGRGFGGPGGPPGRRGGFGRTKFKDIDFRKMDFSVIKRILGYLWNYKARFIVSVICIIVSAVTSVLTATAFGTLIDDYITPMMATGFSGAMMVSYMLKIGSLYLITIIAMFVQQRMYVVMTQGIMRDIRQDMFSHMQTLPIKYFDTNTFGDIMSHYTNDIDTMQQLISQSMPQVLSAVITLITSIVTMFKTSIWMTLFMFVFVFIITKITTKIAGISGAYFMGQQEAVGSLNGFIEEMVDGQKVIKVFNHEKAAIEEFDGENENLRDIAKNASFYGSMMGPIMGSLGNFQYVLTAIFGAVLVALGVANLTITGVTALTLGNVVIFLTLGRRFNMTISNVAQQMNSIVMAMAGANRIFRLMDEQPEDDEGKVTLVNAMEDANGNLTECKQRTGIWAWKVPMGTGYIYIKLEGDVRLSHVDFGYKEEKQILYDVSLFAKPGQKVAFVGSTGAGKTTITNLINRFYDINAGDITYDGIPVKDIKKSDLRTSLGIVLQDVNLFTGTIRENIRYGRLNATDEEVIAAAKLANAHDFIMRLPNGYDTEIDGSGSQLSQGQRQLISIARAAIGNPPVMIMDEATSSIDTRTEILVQKGMDSLMQGRTVFVIAHRLSTVMNSDVIMVLEKGRIIERGSHDELIEQKGRYYQLYTGNFAEG